MQPAGTVNPNFCDLFLNNEIIFQFEPRSGVFCVTIEGDQLCAHLVNSAHKYAHCKLILQSLIRCAHFFTKADLFFDPSDGISAPIRTRMLDRETVFFPILKILLIYRAYFIAVVFYKQGYSLSD